MKQFAPSEKLDTDVRLLRNKQDMFVTQGHDDLFIHFSPQILMVLSSLPLAKV